MIHIHKMCKNWKNEKQAEKQRQMRRSQKMKRAKSEIVVASKREDEGKKMVRIKTSISHRGHQRMRSTDNYAMRYEHQPIGTNLVDIDLEESDDLKHDDVDVCVGMRMSQNEKRFVVVGDSLSNSESESEQVF